jgi:DNA repair exonuclease SbcCD ATPase subunit
MDFDMFMNIIYCDTNNMISILNANKPTKRDYIEKLFGLSYFTDLKKKADEKKREINEKLLSLESEYKVLSESLKSLKFTKDNYDKDILSIKSKIENLDKTLKKYDINKIESDIKEIISEISISEAEQKLIEKEQYNKNLLIEKIKIKIKELLKHKTDFIDYEKSYKEEIKKYDELLQARILLVNEIEIDEIKEELGASEESLKSTETVLTKEETEFNILSKELKDIEEIDNPIYTAEDLDKLKNLYEKSKEFFSQEKAWINQLNKEIKDVEKELQEKPKDGKCPVCLQEVDFAHIEEEMDKILQEKQTILNERIDLNQYQTTINKKLEEIRKIEHNLYLYSFKEKFNKKNKLEKSTSQLKIEQGDIQNSIKSLKEEINQYDLLETDINEYKSKINSLIEEFNENKKEKDKYLKFQRYLKAIKKLKEKLIELYNESVKSFDDDIKKFKDRLNELEEQKSSYNSLMDESKNNQDKKNMIKIYVKNNEDEILKTETKIKDIQKKTKTFKTAVEYLKEINVICGDTKAKQYAISRHLPYLNERVAKHLNETGVNFYVKLSGWLDCDINGPGIKDCKYSNLSGAEKISLDRAFQIASIDIKKSQSSSFIDLLIFDEVLDSSVDDSGIYDIINIIKKKQLEDDSKVLIVSHRSEVGNLDEIIDYKYLIENDGSYSKIKEL